jgi:hypothetical protein
VTVAGLPATAPRRRALGRRSPGPARAAAGPGPPGVTVAPTGGHDEICQAEHEIRIPEICQSERLGPSEEIEKKRCSNSSHCSKSSLSSQVSESWTLSAALGLRPMIQDSIANGAGHCRFDNERPARCTRLRAGYIGSRLPACQVVDKKVHNGRPATGKPV